MKTVNFFEDKFTNGLATVILYLILGIIGINGVIHLFISDIPKIIEKPRIERTRFCPIINTEISEWTNTCIKNAALKADDDKDDIIDSCKNAAFQLYCAPGFIYVIGRKNSSEYKELSIPQSCQGTRLNRVEKIFCGIK